MKNWKENWSSVIFQQYLEIMMTELTKEAREDIIDRLVDQWTDSMDIGDLIRFFADAQREYLDNETDADLLVHCDNSGVYLDETV